MFTRAARNFNGLIATACLSLLVGVSLLSNTVAQTTAVYKWIDENGQVHFGDQPVDRSAEKIEINSSTQSDNEYEKSLGKQTRLLEIYGEEREEKELQRETARQDKLKRQNNCTQARKNLEDIRSAGFLYEDTDDPFNPRILSHEERAAETARAETAVNRWCK